jgi:DNA polymerase I-like protein with 3'-5' exonuclease and polymerase domains
LDLFPISEADFYDSSITNLIRTFHREYDTNKPPSTAQKEKFGKLRKVAKIIQLAVGYTGTKYTVAKNLTQAGFPTDLDVAGRMVRRYWQKFSKVETLSGQLKALAESRGYINGIYGRRLYIPKKQTKDALNRFAQFAGHAILREIVLEIERTKIKDMYAILPDIHDSTSWEVPADKYDQAVQIFETAIRRVNDNLNLPVQVRGEIKQFNTFFGLKNKEE